MKKNRFIHTILALLLMGCAPLLMGCADDNADENAAREEILTFHLNLLPFEGEATTRAKADGTGFEAGEKFRMEIICPHSCHHENGEPWSSSYHEITLAEGNRVNGSWTYGTVSSYEAQATTYIYSAQNTTGTRIFVIGDERYTRPSNFFYADQSKLDQYKNSDIVWAQAIRQTGAREVHLNFKHKVAKLDITIKDEGIAHKFTGNAILTLENMPDIDGAEIVVGDYYADDSYVDYHYNYREKASSSYENNGKVLGIEVIDEKANRSKIWPMSGNPSNPGGTNSSVFNPNGSAPATPVPNTGVYTAYHDLANAKHYTLYVPACDLDPEGVGGKNAVFWLREGTERYSVILDRTKFEEGVCYKMDLAFGEFTPAKTAWVATASSTASSSDGDDDEHKDEYDVAKAVDGDVGTYWMSEVEAEGQHPYIEIDLKKNYQVSYITYTPRQDENVGRIKDFEVYYKEPEDNNWHRLYTWKTTFDYADGDTSVQTIPFYSIWAQQIKIVALSTVDGGNAASAAEIGIKAVGVK